MAKTKVTFWPVRKSEDDWSILAEYPGIESREITGFNSKSDVDDWMNGERRIGWLRTQGYAKWSVDSAILSGSPNADSSPRFAIALRW